MALTNTGTGGHDADPSEAAKAPFATSPDEVFDNGTPVEFEQ
jgi:hypothetical protein